MRPEGQNPFLFATSGSLPHFFRRRSVDASSPLRAFSSQFFSQPFQDSLGAGGLGKRFRAELNCIVREPNAEIFYGSLLNFAARLEEADLLPPALEIYRRLGEASAGQVPGAIREEALVRRDAVLGEGRFSPRLEASLRHLARDFFSPEMLLMPAALSIGKLGYAGLFRKFAASPGLLRLGGKLGVQALAVLGASAAEVSGFTLLAKGAGEVLGRPTPWTAEVLFQEILDGALFLGPMKVAHALGAKLKIPVPVAAFGGIFLANQAQAAFQHKTFLSNDALMADSVLAALHYFVGARISGSLLGASGRRFLHEASLRSASVRPEARAPSASLSAVRVGGSTPPVQETIFQINSPEGGSSRPPPAKSALGAGPPVVVARLPLPKRDSPPAASRRAASGTGGPKLTFSFTPPPPSVDVKPMSSQQGNLLDRVAGEIREPDLKAIALARVAAELYYAGKTDNGKSHFDDAAQLMRDVADTSLQKGRAFSHLALEHARIGDVLGCREHFLSAFRQVCLLQMQPDLREAYALVLTIAGDMMGGQNELGASQFLRETERRYASRLGGNFPVDFAEPALLKLAREGHFDEAMLLLKHLPYSDDGPKLLFSLGKFVAQRGKLEEATRVLAMYGNPEEANPLRAQISLAYAARGEGELARQHLDGLTELSHWIETLSLTARTLYLRGKGQEASDLQDYAGQTLHERSRELTPERRGELFAILAGNSVLANGGNYSRYFYLALAELESWLGGTEHREIPDGVMNALAEMAFSSQLAGEAEKTESLLQSLSPGLKSRLRGEVVLKFAEGGQLSPAQAWLSLIPEPERSPHQRNLALKMLYQGKAANAYSLAEKIPDAALRFDALWEIFSQHRGVRIPGKPPTLPPPRGVGPPPLPGKK